MVSQVLPHHFASVERRSTPEEITTLIEMLAFRAANTPDKDAFIFNKDGGYTFAALWRDVNSVASFLAHKGVRQGDRVVLIFPNSREFFPAFYGIQRAGGVAVPLFPGSGIRRILMIAHMSRAKAVIVPPNISEDDLQEYERLGKTLNIPIYRYAEAEAFTGEVALPVVQPDDVAFFQYTSGSTGDPKGVQLSHRNLIANVRQMTGIGWLTDQDVLVSWLPVYHDLGLILMTMCPFYLAAKLVLLPTDLANLGRWLEAITEHKGTFTASPDIGYRLCIKYVRNPDQYDLSSLRVAINAAEPIRSSTVAEFEEKFKVKHVIKPAYGLAEASVGVTFWSKNEDIKVDERGFVAVGYPFPDIELKVVKDNRIAEPGEIGELVFRSPAQTRGYYNNPEATARLQWQDGFIYSGDLAYFDKDGDLFIVGREKNIIKHSGRTVAPVEVEEIADGVTKVRSAAAVGVDKGGPEGEQVYVFAEVRLPQNAIETEAPAIVRQIAKSIHDGLGFRPARIYLVKPHTIPMTYNGKIQHVELKRRFTSGALREDEQIIYPDY
jgi:acyl-CoA synthetase (AMP-forming)/AMP-acid ligase II